MPTLARAIRLLSAFALLTFASLPSCKQTRPAPTSHGDNPPASAAQDRIVVTITCDLMQLDADYMVGVELAKANGEIFSTRVPVQVQSDAGAVGMALRAALDHHGVVTPEPIITSKTTREIVLPVGCHVVTTNVSRIHGAGGSTCFTVVGWHG